VACDVVEEAPVDPARGFFCRRAGADSCRRANAVFCRRAIAVAVLSAASTVVVLAAGGCGGRGTLPVTGTVRLADGAPVANATVVFESAGLPVSPSGTTDATGRFSLTAFQRHDGAPAGDYRIAVHPPLAADSSEEQPASPFDPRYASASTSGLEFTVARGSTTCDLVLDPPARKAAR